MPIWFEKLSACSRGEWIEWRCAQSVRVVFRRVCGLTCLSCPFGRGQQTASIYSDTERREKSQCLRRGSNVSGGISRQVKTHHSAGRGSTGKTRACLPRLLASQLSFLVDQMRHVRGSAIYSRSCPAEPAVVVSACTQCSCMPPACEPAMVVEWLQIENWFPICPSLGTVALNRELVPYLPFPHLTMKLVSHRTDLATEHEDKGGDCNLFTAPTEATQRQATVSARAACTSSLLAAARVGASIGTPHRSCN